MIEKIRNRLEQGYTQSLYGSSSLLIEQMEDDISSLLILFDAQKRAFMQNSEMYKECLAQFLPASKWDEANEFLSTYGSGLAKDLKNKER